MVSFVDTDYIYRAVSKKYLEVFGLPMNKIIRHHVPEIHGKEMFENNVKSYMDKTLAEETQHTQLWNDIHGQTQRCLEVMYFSYRGEDGTITGVVISARDITDKKLAEREIARYKYIVDSTSDRVSFVDKDYVYRAVNKLYLKWFGKKQNEIVRHSLVDVKGKYGQNN